MVITMSVEIQYVGLNRYQVGQAKLELHLPFGGTKLFNATYQTLFLL